MNIIWLILGSNAVMWILIFIGFRIQRARLEQKLREDVSFTGEYLILGPQNGYYNKMKGIVSVKSMGVMALTNKRLIFRLPFSKGFEIPFDQITEVSESTWFQGNYRNGANFMILKLRDDSEIAFQTKDSQNWSEQIRSQISG